MKSQDNSKYGNFNFSSQSPIPSETVLSDEDNWSPKDENSSNVFESNLPFEEFPRSNSSKIKMMSSKCNEKGKEVRIVVKLSSDMK